MTQAPAGWGRNVTHRVYPASRSAPPRIPWVLSQRYPVAVRGFTFHSRPRPAKLVPVISQTDPGVATKRITDLQRAQPVDATLKNLLGVLNAKLELCASLPLYEWEAGSEGYDECAAAFRRLAEDERRSCNAVMERLRHHLERRAQGVAGARS
jgi:hypothetical protein